MTIHRKKMQRGGSSFSSMSVGERIQWLLIVRQLTQSEAARMSGISQSTIANLVSTPARSPSANTLFALARTLKAAPEFLLHGEGLPLDDVPFTNDESTLLATFRNLDPFGRRNLLTFALLLIKDRATAPIPQKSSPRKN